jgi:BlaI family transcriptional regulator, penicillinase repressor
MPQPRLSRLELQVMELVWSHGAQTVREIQERFPEKTRPAYTTVQTVVNRLEAKGALGRARKLGNAHIFEPTVSRNAAQRPLIDEFLAMFGGRMQPLMAHLVESGRLTLADVQEAEKKLQELSRKKGSRK